MFGNYRPGKEVQEKLDKIKRNSTAKVSYRDNSDKIIKIKKQNENGITVSEDMRMAIVKPTYSYKPVKQDVSIIKNMKQVSPIKSILRGFTGLLAVDIETNGVCAHKKEDKIVGIGIASADKIVYIDILSASPQVIGFIYEWLAEYPDGLIGHNIFFDGAFLQREVGRWLPWVGDTYGMYRQLANEGYPQQRWGLKDAQIQLLNYDGKGDVELDQWLVENGHVSDIKLKPKDGYYQLDDGKWYKAKKSEMWRAPAEILGYYCGIDAASTYQLWTEVFMPSISGEPFEESLLTYHDVYVTNVKLLVSQQLSGITIDKDKLTIYHQKLLSEIKNHKPEFFNHEKVRPIADEFNAMKLKDMKDKEPEKFKKQKQPKEPAKFKANGEISKTWLNWSEKMEMLAESGPEISKNWLTWKQKYDEMLDKEHMNLNSSKDMQWLFYEKLGFPIKNTTKSGQPSTGADALPGLGEVGQLLKRQKDLVKEESYVKACLDNLIKDDDNDWRLHPQFRTPGTLTCRLAGSGGVNLQQVPKSRGYLECWRPKKGKVWIDYDFCLSPDHQVLTKNRGWVPILNVETSDKVWQVNPHTKEGSWINPLRTIKKHFFGNMYEFGNRRGKIKVTENHRMLFENQNNKKRAIKETLAQDLIPGTGWNLPITTYSNSVSKFSKEEIWKVCMLQADTYFHPKYQSYVLQLSKERKRNKAQELLNRRGSLYRRNNDTLEIETWCGIKNNSELLEGKSFNLRKLGANQAEDFIEALRFWDGSTDKKRTIWGCTDLKAVEEVQSYLVRSGYEAKLSFREFINPNHKTYYFLSIKKDAQIRLKEEDVNITQYTGLVGCVTVPEGYFLVRRQGQTFITGNCALEQVVLTELSKDESLLNLYGPNSSPYQDVYIYNGALMAKEFGVKLFQPFIDEGYDPENPDPEVIKTIKKKHKKLRGISKVASLGKAYGMGSGKFKQNMANQNVIMSIDESKAVIEGLDKVYSGVREFNGYLEHEWKENNGYVINGIGRPVGCARDYLKDIVNRVVQSTGHDLLMIYIAICDELFTKYNIKVNGIVWDFHDQTMLECNTEDVEKVKHIMEIEAAHELNDRLGGEIMLKLDGGVIETFADAKVEG